MSSPSLTHDKGLPKHLEELDKSHLEGDLRHKQPGSAPAPPHIPTSRGPVRLGQRCPLAQAGKPRPPEAEDLGPPRGSEGPGFGDHTSGPAPGLTSSALPAGPGKLGGEAAHLPHLRPPPESQPSSSPLLQTAPGVKGHQRVVTLAQHISVTTPSLPPTLGGRGPGEGRVTRSPGLVGKLSPGGPDGGCRVGQGRRAGDSRVSNSDAATPPPPTDGASGVRTPAGGTRPE